MRTNTTRSAFTLVEILVVVALVAVLAGISISIGASMADSGRTRATEGILQALDQTLDRYVNQTGSVPPALVPITLSQAFNENGLSGFSAGDTIYLPAIDGSALLDNNEEETYQVNTIGLFLASIADAIDVDADLSQIDSKFVKRYNNPDDRQPELLTIFDAWGNPIRYVHPKFDGIIEDSTSQADRRMLGEPGDPIDISDVNTGFFTIATLPVSITDITIPIVRRNKITNADKEEARSNAMPGDEPNPFKQFVWIDSDGGTCPGQRPYFYSAGPDGDPSTTEDNIYTTQPIFTDPL